MNRHPTKADRRILDWCRPLTRAEILKTLRMWRGEASA